MEVVQKYFPVVLFIILHKVVLTLKSVDEILRVTIQMKATVRYFLVELFVFQHFVA